MDHEAMPDAEQKRIEEIGQWIDEEADLVGIDEGLKEAGRQAKLEDIKMALQDAIDENAKAHAESFAELVATLGTNLNEKNVDKMIDDVVSGAVQTAKIPENLKGRVASEPALRQRATKVLAETIESKLAAANDEGQVSALEKLLELLEDHKEAA